MFVPRGYELSYMISYMMNSFPLTPSLTADKMPHVTTFADRGGQTRKKKARIASVLTSELLA